MLLDISNAFDNDWILGFNTGAAYNHKYWREKKGISHMEIQLSLEVPISNNLSGIISAAHIGDISSGVKKGNSYVLGNVLLKYGF